MKNTRRRFNHRGLELPVGMLIIIIISIIIFGASLFIFGKIREGLKTITYEIDRETDAELRRLMRQELAVVAIPYPTQKVRPGKDAAFWIGIRNIGASTQTYTVSMFFSHIVHPDFTITEPNEAEQVEVTVAWAGGLATQTTEQVQPQEFVTVPLVFKTQRRALDAPLNKGDQIIFNVCVAKEGLMPMADPSRMIGQCEPGAVATSALYDGKIHQITAIVE